MQISLTFQHCAINFFVIAIKCLNYLIMGIMLKDAQKTYWVTITKNSKIHWKKKWSHFDLKSWVTGGTKIRSNWRIFESNWLGIESQFDSVLRVNLTRYWESICSVLRVNLTRYWESIWLKYSLINRNPGSNFSPASDSTL